MVNGVSNIHDDRIARSVASQGKRIMNVAQNVASGDRHPVAWTYYRLENAIASDRFVICQTPGTLRMFFFLNRVTPYSVRY